MTVEAAWDELHDARPDHWYVGRLMYRDEARMCGAIRQAGDPRGLSAGVRFVGSVRCGGTLVKLIALGRLVAPRSCSLRMHGRHRALG